MGIAGLFDERDIHPSMTHYFAMIGILGISLPQSNLPIYFSLFVGWGGALVFGLTSLITLAIGSAKKALIRGILSCCCGGLVMICLLPLTNRPIGNLLHYQAISVYAPALALGILGIVRSRSLSKADDSEPICPKCHYSLIGNKSGVCPECGERLKSDKSTRKSIVQSANKRFLILVLSASLAFIAIILYVSQFDNRNMVYGIFATSIVTFVIYVLLRK